MEARAEKGTRVTCARRGAFLTLAAPCFAHSAAAAYLLGDLLAQRQRAGAGPHRPVAQSLLHGDGLVRCNRHSRWGRAGGGGGESTAERAEDGGVASHWHSDWPGLAWPVSQPGNVGPENPHKNVGRNSCRGSFSTSSCYLFEGTPDSHPHGEPGSRKWGCAYLSPGTEW